MDRLKEIETRMAQIRSEVESTEDIAKVEELNKEVEALKEERKAIEETKKQKEIAEKLEEKSLDAKEINFKEERKMDERKYDIKSAEYRTAWAKTMMGLELDEIDKRAIGDAIGTTATEFTASTANTNGINNLGLLIPDSVRLDWLKMQEQASPIYRDIRKLNINGNIDFPYLFGADDSAWYSETTTTNNEGQEYKNIKLTGHELSKAIEITWKAEAMTVEGFISFLLDELNEKMNKALIKACIYGTGTAQPTGITNGLTAKTDSNVIDLIKICLGSLSAENRIGAKVYIASDIADEIAFYKDKNGNYPYLIAGLGRAGGATIETDPFLNNGDIVVGNPQNYVLNFNEGLRIDKEIKVQPRRVVYGGYLIADGNKKPNSFIYGKKIASQSSDANDGV